MISLNTLPVGARAQVVQVSGERSFRRRLLELGLLPGSELRLIRATAISGLLEVEVRGCFLSIRAQEASEVLVQATAEGSSS